MKFTGEYQLKIIGGRVEIPWKISSEEKLVWVLFEINIDDEKNICCQMLFDSDFNKTFSEEQMEQENVKILFSGEVKLDIDKKWSVPQPILQHLRTMDIVFCGSGNFAEIMTEEEMENYKKLIDELTEQLRIAAIEEGLYE